MTQTEIDRVITATGGTLSQLTPFILEITPQLIG